MNTPDFQLREASLDDLDAFYGLFAQVQSIHAEAQPEFLSPAREERALAPAFPGHPGQSGSAPCLRLPRWRGGRIGSSSSWAFARGASFRPVRRVGYINGLVVDAAHRRTGCGARLLEHVKQAARREDVTILGIDFWSFNAAARACFEKAGFKVSLEFMWLGL